MKQPKEAKNHSTSNEDMIYTLEGRPSLSAALPLGLQHILSMFIANLAPVLVIAGIVSVSTGENIVSEGQRLLMVQLAMFVSGIATFLQLYPIKLGKFQIGAGLPIVMGTSFVFVPALCAIGADWNIETIYGTVIVGSIAEVFLGLFLKPLRRFFPPVVIGCVLLAIGLSLLPIGIQYLAGGMQAQTAAAKAAELSAQGLAVPTEMSALAAQFGSWQNLLTGSIVILVIVLFQRFMKKLFKALAILAGIVVGYIVAACFGIIDYSIITSAAPFSPPIPALVPEFHIEPIIAILAFYIISGLETMGNVNGITAAIFDREAKAKEASGAILGDAVGSLFAGCFNTLPNTAFGQNAGIVAMTKVINKFVVATGASILVLASLFPMFGAIFSAIPNCVLGGAVITIFGMVLANGMKLINIDGLTANNILIICLSFGVGYGISHTPLLVGTFPEPLHFIFSQPVLAISIVAVLANIIFNKTSAKVHRSVPAEEV